MKNIHNQKEITILETEYLEFLKLKEENLVLEQKLSNLLEQLSKFKRDKFGSSSEKISDELMDQMSLFLMK